MEYKNKIVAYDVCWKCKSEITEYDANTLLCEPCFEEVKGNCPTFNRFDICEAWYQYAVDWHNGLFSRSYEIFGRLDNMRFKMSPLHNNYDDLTENGKLIYENLVIKRY